MKTTELFAKDISISSDTGTVKSLVPASSEEKAQITSELIAFIDSMRAGMKNLNADDAFKSFLKTADFNYIGIHGDILSYNDFYNEANSVFGPADKVEYNFEKSDIKILSHEVALITYRFSGTFYFPDSKLYFPMCGTSLVLIKTSEGWRVIQMQESIQESKFEQSPIDS